MSVMGATLRTNSVHALYPGARRRPTERSGKHGALGGRGRWLQGGLDRRAAEPRRAGADYGRRRARHRGGPAAARGAQGGRHRHADRIAAPRGPGRAAGGAGGSPHSRAETGLGLSDFGPRRRLRSDLGRRGPPSTTAGLCGLSSLQRRCEAMSSRSEAEDWAEELEAVAGRIAPRFGRAEPRPRPLAYLPGLPAPLEPKNGWPLAGAARAPTPNRTP